MLAMPEAPIHPASPMTRAAAQQAWWTVCGGDPADWPLKRADPALVAEQLVDLRRLALCDCPGTCNAHSETPVIP